MQQIKFVYYCIHLSRFYGFISISCTQLVARLGIAVTGSIGYQLEPAVTGQVCASCSSLGARTCYTVHQSWPNSEFEIYAYYQLATFTGYGVERRFSAASVNQQFGSQVRRLLAQDCGGPNEAVCDVTEPPPEDNPSNGSGRISCEVSCFFIACWLIASIFELLML